MNGFQPIWHVAWKYSSGVARDQMQFFFSFTKVAGVSDTKKAFLRMCTADLQISHAGRITLSIAILFKLQYSVKGLDTKNIN